MADPRRRLVALSVSAAAFAGILAHEGFRSTAYDDGVGVQTIGYGTTAGVKPGDTITEPEARARARREVVTFEGAIKQCVHVPLSQNEYDAYVDLAYNIGTGNFCSSTLVKLLNEGQYAAACAQITRWDRAGGRVMKGLTKRRQAERALCEG